MQSFSNRAVRLDAPFPYAAVNKSSKKPLRLNSEAFNAASNFDALQDALPLAFVSNHLKSFCSPWDKLLLLFLDGYFEHIAEMLCRHHTECTKKLAPFAGLYKVEDWAFSVPKPLPRAHLYAPLNSGGAWDEGKFVQVDFAFWLGERMTAVLSHPGILTPAKARERQSRLEQAGVAVVTFTEEDLAKDRTDLFNRIIGDFGALLDSAGAVPIGPFRPQMLED